MIKKLGIILIIAISTSSAFYKVSSYTFADVKSGVDIQINDSQNALIGIPEYMEGINLVQGGSSNFEVSIRNNMSSSIWIIGAFGSGSGIGIELKNAVSVLPGGTNSIPLEVIAENDAMVGDNLIGIIYEIIWDGGSAKINGEICINISEPIVIQNSTQSIIKGKYSYVETQILNTNNARLRVLGVDFPGEKGIAADISGIEIKEGRVFLPIMVTSLEPNLYEIPVLYTVELDGCNTIVESKLFLEVILEDIK